MLNIFTDGSCTPNPGEMRVGVAVLRGAEVVHRISKPMGFGTSNQAELLAIKEALQYIPAGEPAVIHIDSKYAIGVIGKNWNATKNLGLISDIKTLYRRFTNIRLVKVKGHSGIHGNELADSLAEGCTS